MWEQKHHSVPDLRHEVERKKSRVLLREGGVPALVLYMGDVPRYWMPNFGAAVYLPPQAVQLFPLRKTRRTLGLRYQFEIS